MAVDNIAETKNIVLSNQQRVDQLLSFPPVFNEVKETFRRAIAIRNSDAPVRPPHFKYVSDFNSTVYCPIKSQAYQGRWDEYHGWLIQDNQLIDSDTGERYPYISGYSFILRGAPDIRVLRLDLVETFELQDLTTLESLGYTVMDPEHWWVVKDPASPVGWSLHPSVLTPPSGPSADGDNKAKFIKASS